jgi:hypothetical protein
MKMLVARRKDRAFRFVVHLDITKMLADGTTPDPAWCLEQSWARPETESADWQVGVRDDLRVDCDARLAELIDAADPGVALPQEGKVF